MKTTLIFLILCTVALAAEPELDGIAAVVNEEVITFRQLRAQAAPDEPLLGEKYKGKDLVDAIKKLRASHLDRLVDRLLLLQELKRQAQPFPSDPTDEQIDAIIKKRFSSDRQQWLERVKRKALIKVYQIPP